MNSSQHMEERGTGSKMGALRPSRYQCLATSWEREGISCESELGGQEVHKTGTKTDIDKKNSLEQCEEIRNLSLKALSVFLHRRIPDKQHFLSSTGWDLKKNLKIHTNEHKAKRAKM